MTESSDISSAAIKLDRISNRVFTIPNILTFFRILLLPVLIWALEASVQIGYAYAVIVGSIMILTDLLDGIAARKLNQRSRLGMILDPISDKFIISSLAIYFAIKGSIPTWIVIIIVARDFAILIFGLIMLKHNYAPKPIIWGRLSPFLWAISFLFLVIGQEGYAWSIMVIALVLGIFSAGAYYANYRKVMEECE